MRKKWILLIASMFILTGCSQTVNENNLNENGNTFDKGAITEEATTTINTTIAPTTTVTFLKRNHLVMYF